MGDILCQSLFQMLYVVHNLFHDVQRLRNLVCTINSVSVGIFRILS